MNVRGVGRLPRSTPLTPRDRRRKAIMTTTRPTLSPEMLLVEVAALCSRHGLAVSTATPSAALHHAARLLQALGLTVPAEPPPAIAAAPMDSTTVLPRMAVPQDRPVSFTRGSHRPGAPRSLRLADNGA